jgi:P-type Ca2+ transporter type 2C
MINNDSAAYTSSGLTAREAADLLASDGYNELPSSRQNSIWPLAASVIREPMFVLLVGCGAIYLALGNKQEALVLLAFVFVIMGITFFQKHRAGRALEALRDLSSPHAMVIRDRQQKRVHGREIVRGDLIVLVEGERVPADAVLLSSMNLTLDESQLTGESVPVRKLAIETDIPLTPAQPGGDDLPFVFSGSLVVQGKGVARVLATGANTALGRIGTALYTQKEEPTRLQTEVARIIKYAASLCVLLAILLAVWYGISRNDWLTGVLAGITFAMALLPEELPVILTIFLGLGAWRMAQKQVLARHIPAIETLGAATVLCVDKTGTLTQNRMAVATLFSGGEWYEVEDVNSLPPENFHEVLEFAMLASHRDPFDPMEKSIQEAGHSALARTEHLHDSWKLVEEYPLSKELLAMSRVWHSEDRQQYVIAAKGSPEAIADLCHLDQAQTQSLIEQTNALAAQGLRVLGVAKASFALDQLPAIQHDFEFVFLGLIGFADPLRPSVTAAIDECHTAGIRIIMITGDYPATALSIAEQSGLSSAGGIITGAELDAMDELTLARRIQDVNIFCRVVPEQKLRLVNALKSAGDIVAMTGDGVNDAPALKAAHIGIAMGARGTDVAREAAALVLLDNDFSSIVAAVRLGRRIFDNLRKTIAFIVAVHLPIVGMSFVPVMAGWPLFLMPIHILFLQLVIDPTCSLVFEAEPEEPGVMKRPPRPTNAAIFDRQVLKLGLLQGVVLFIVVVAIFAVAQNRGLPVEQARALAFAGMIIGNIGLIFINRSWSIGWRASLASQNRALWWTVGSTLAFLPLVLYVPPIADLFYFRPPPLISMLVSVLAVVFVIGLLRIAQFSGGNWGGSKQPTAQ